MPRTHSPDLRHRIVQHALQATPRDTAHIFQVNPRTVRRLLNLKRQTGTLRSRVSTGRTKKLDATIDAALGAHCDAYPDHTLEQYQQHLKLEQHVSVVSAGRYSAWGGLEKKTLHASERDPICSSRVARCNLNQCRV